MDTPVDQMAKRWLEQHVILLARGQHPAKPAPELMRGRSEVPRTVPEKERQNMADRAYRYRWPPDHARMGERSTRPVAPWPAARVTSVKGGRRSSRDVQFSVDLRDPVAPCGHCPEYEKHGRLVHFAITLVEVPEVVMCDGRYAPSGWRLVREIVPGRLWLWRSASGSHTAPHASRRGPSADSQYLPISNFEWRPRSVRWQKPMQKGPKLAMSHRTGLSGNGTSPTARSRAQACDRAPPA